MPPKIKSEQERQKIRSAILDAARDLFVEQGVDAVTMRAIARRVGCSATALYLHFSDKESLVRELCDTDFMALSLELRTMEQIADPLERLHSIGIGYARFALEHPNHYRLMFMTPQLACSIENSGRERGNVEQDAYACLKAAVGYAFDAGHFRPELQDPELIAQTLWAGVHGVCAQAITMGGSNWIDWRPVEDRVGLMSAALLRGLRREAS